MNYSDQLKDPRWQKKRLSILSRDKFTCILCHDDKTELHVHHKIYLKGRKPWEYSDDNFDIYCKFCHEIVEAVKKTGFAVMEVKKNIINPNYEILFALCKSLKEFNMAIFSKTNNKLVFSTLILPEDLVIMNNLFETHKPHSQNGKRPGIPILSR